MPDTESKFFIPSVNRDVFERLYDERNEIVKQYNSLANQIALIQPETGNYEECSETLLKLTPEVRAYCRRNLNCIKDFESYELNLTYDYTGSQEDNFRLLEFKIRMSYIIGGLQRDNGTITKLINDTWGEIKILESLTLTNRIESRVSKFFKHHPFIFVFELVIHIAVIIIGLKKLHII